MKRLISIILSLCLLAGFAAAETTPAAQETAEMTAEELYRTGFSALEAGEDNAIAELFGGFVRGTEH